ncbi:hypothetical protein SAMN05443270_4621 [Lacrimispora sphenoides]|jgi:hypothetical protein|nr:hypothetical protein SAMN05443270_4621 [Lacrimispora sphenoides]
MGALAFIGLIIGLFLEKVRHLTHRLRTQEN